MFEEHWGCRLIAYLHLWFIMEGLANIVYSMPAKFLISDYPHSVFDFLNPPEKAALKILDGARQRQRRSTYYDMDRLGFPANLPHPYRLEDLGPLEYVLQHELTPGYSTQFFGPEGPSFSVHFGLG